MTAATDRPDPFISRQSYVCCPRNSCRSSRLLTEMQQEIPKSHVYNCRQNRRWRSLSTNLLDGPHTTFTLPAICDAMPPQFHHDETLILRDKARTFPAYLITNGSEYTFDEIGVWQHCPPSAHHCGLASCCQDRINHRLIPSVIQPARPLEKPRHCRQKPPCQRGNKLVFAEDHNHPPK